MAEKDKVPVAAIRQIVQMRNDEYRNCSYKMIAEKIKDDFGVEVTQQAIGYLYRRNKDKFTEMRDSESAEYSQKSVTRDTVNKPTKLSKPVFKPKKKPALDESAFEKDEAIDLKNLFEPTE